MTLDEIYDAFVDSTGICTDTRSIQEGCMFVALKGENFNGNTFAQKALEQGAKYAMIDEGDPTPDSRLIKVDDCLGALQDLARAHRQRFKGTVIGITGSNGKTTTKELVRDVLATQFTTKATRGNLNNHIGVPLTILETSTETQMVIIEMGANHQKEIEFLCSIATPDFGLITNVGKAHLEGFGGVEGVKKGKKELFDYLVKSSGKAFINSSDQKVEALAHGAQQIKFGSPDYLPFGESQNDNGKLTFRLTGKKGRTDWISTHLVGDYNLVNIVNAISVGMHFGVDQEEAIAAVSAYVPDNNRSEIRDTGKNKVILDAYNANPSSMEHALKNFANIKDAKLCILGDMLELGESSYEEHHQIILLCEKLQLNCLFIGKEFHQLNQTLPANSERRYFESRSMAREHLSQEDFKDLTILMKASRGLALEKLIDLL